ncbi:MAG TPA: hypothetical protein GX506_09190 [Firmicutes bacterium]|nr:hypothetical protein [Bacillota bacterium]
MALACETSEAVGVEASLAGGVTLTVGAATEIMGAGEMKMGLAALKWVQVKAALLPLDSAWGKDVSCGDEDVSWPVGISASRWFPTVGGTS